VNPQYGYGWAVPFLAAYVFFLRLRRAPPPAKPSANLLPVVLIIAAAFLFIPVRLVQEANPDWRLLSWIMVIIAISISFAGIYLARGLQSVRHFAFPLLFFLVAVPWPTQVEQAVIQGLMRVVAAINVEVLNAIGISALQLGNVIEVGSGLVGIDEACTGVRSLQATFMVSLFLGEFYSFTTTRRVILVIAGALLAFFCNLARTFFLVYLGAERGSEAIQRCHDPAGLTILMACLFGLWGISMLMTPATQERSAAAHPKIRAPFHLSRALLISLLALICTAEAGTQFWYRLHEAGGAKAQPWSVMWPAQSRDWRSVPVASEAQELLRYNEGGGGAWTGEDGRQWALYFFKWLPGRTAGLFIKNHRPDICLPASGMKLRGGVQNRLITVNGVTLPIRSYTFEDGSNLLHVYYCYWDGTPPESAPQDQENWTAGGRMEAVQRGKRDVGTQMLEIVASGYTDQIEAEQAMREQLHLIIRRG